MTKSELLKLLEPFDDDEEIHAWWCDKITPIKNVTCRDDFLIGTFEEGKVCMDFQSEEDF